MPVICPTCAAAAIDQANINVPKDVAFCTACNNIAALSTLVDAASFSSVSLNPPKGSWYHDDGNQMRVGATTRHPIAFFLVPFMLVWSGMSLGGMYGSQIVSHQFDLFRTLVGIPFLIGSLIFWSATMMAIAGKAEVTISGTEGRVFLGVGSLGWTRRFDPTSISSISYKYESFGRGGMKQVIVLKAPAKSLSFGSGLSDVRRDFIAAVLSKTLLARPRP